MSLGNAWKETSQELSSNEWITTKKHSHSQTLY